MAAAHDTDAFLAQVRRLARAPSATAGSGWADADLLAFANGELSALTSKLMKERQDYLSAYKDETLVAGTASYRLPTRALLNKLREAMLIASDGTKKNLPAGGVGRLDGRDLTNGSPEFYYIEGNSIVLSPPPDASTYTTLRLWYFRRPNRLVGTSAVLTSTSLTGTTVFNGTKPSTILTTTPVDVVQGRPPYDSLGDDLTPSAVAAGSVTFGTGVTGALKGDYVCLAGESPVIQLPDELYHLLALRTALCLPVTADVATLLTRKLGEAEESIFGAIQDRNEGEPPMVVNSVWD